jgi:hypothetical protein
MNERDGRGRGEEDILEGLGMEEDGIELKRRRIGKNIDEEGII